MAHIITAQGYSSFIPVLLSKDTKGKVLNKYETGFNILAGSRLIFIGTEKNGYSPFGIHLSSQDYLPYSKKVNIGASVTFGPRELIIEDLFSITLRDDKAYDPIVPIEREKITTAWKQMIPKVWLERGYTKILSTDLAVAMEVIWEMKEPTTVEQKMIRRLINCCSPHVSNEEMDAVCHYFVGRGVGLTPSGDDVLVGVAAILYGKYGPRHPFIKGIKKVKDKDRTTMVSQTFYQYASIGAFQSTILSTMHALSSTNESLVAAVNQLLESGHSSGFDTSFGMYVGLIGRQEE
ncbi:hypothetical protein BN1058_00559 [Paraliobacillus sp. PM-2]|uniref:DUF2877 domain-containing protein n=1 Tax=Paraliobacillus sp. PM-2 TaxID=1462524 RepID=UPI00061C36B4|nr:DUF2877 domain-containing protein [Paraliobacillus sp. PM-2]CQR46306.1 hypothetical protein BN1058_00559 [Paraliobacillus sp. PM-2]